MKPLENLLQNAARSQKKIVLSEGSDPPRRAGCH